MGMNASWANQGAGIDNEYGAPYIHKAPRLGSFRWWGKTPLSSDSNCVFCEIIAGREPSKVRYLDEDIIVIVNKLTWVPLMLLVMPKKHMSQLEMWSSGIMPRLGTVAVDMGCTYAWNGFRILSNFGPDGMQSQSHGHLHVIGGTHLGPYA